MNRKDVADLLEACCQDAASRSRRERGVFDPLDGDEGRLLRLLELWGDGRARVRACAVRSLLALAGEITARHVTFPYSFAMFDACRVRFVCIKSLLGRKVRDGR